jgi:hypothetical protein
MLREPLLVFVGTIGGCLLVHEIVRRIPLLRPLFGLKRVRSGSMGRGDPSVRMEQTNAVN